MNKTRLAVLCAMLLPLAAQASFGGATCHKGEFDCQFLMMGVLLGIIGGLPISGVIFVIIQLVFCNPERNKGKQLLLGGFLGVVAFEVAAVAGAAWSAWVQPSSTYAMEAFLVAYVLLAIASALYARSDPGS